MLQINTGKLYQAGIGQTNRLRGVLYTNLVLAGVDETSIETEAGTLLSGEILSDSPNAIVYELTERLEDSKGAPQVLASHTVRPYLNDFAFVVSFALNVTCTPEYDLTARLLSGRRAKTVFVEPSKQIKRAFDKEVWCQKEDAARLQEFVHDLLGLRRKSFLAVMKAIRTYVTGLHRIPDDLEIAYTLLVASIESLAQNYKTEVGTWDDYDRHKREKLEQALEGAEAATADRVKAALVEVEHLALARKFREFTLEYLPADYFKGRNRVAALGRCDMEDALREAYGLRSKYVHSLQRLPDMLSTDHSYRESMRLDHRTLLTLQGLANVVREVIFAFVKREPKVEKELYNYHLELFGVIQAELSPEYWVGRPESLGPKGGRKRLEGFLHQFAGHLYSKTPITTLSAVLPRIEELLPNCTKVQRRSLLALYFIYNRIVPEAEKAAGWKDVVQKYENVLLEPSVEALIAHLLFDAVPAWSIEDHHAVYREYFKQRNRSNGFRAPDVFEAGMGLALAERYRASGEIDAAKGVLSFAVDNAPSNLLLAQFVEGFTPTDTIDWGAILLPKQA